MSEFSQFMQGADLSYTNVMQRSNKLVSVLVLVLTLKKY